MNPPEFWFCCLRAVEQVVFVTYAEALVLTLGAGMPLALWDLVWDTSLDPSPEARAAFLRLYHLEIGTMVVEGLGVDAVVVGGGYEGWWIELGLWVLLPTGLCPDGCGQSQRPG